MSSVISVVSAGLWTASAVLAVAVAYLLILTVAAALAPRRAREVRPVPGSVRLAVIVPAHNEAALLPTLAASLHDQTLSRSQFEVHLVADNCDDATAEIGRAAGFVVHERHHETLRGKGHALDWLMKRLIAEGVTADAFVYVDGDSELSANCLEVIARRFAEGERALQVHYGVSTPETSWSKAMRAGAMLLVNYVRPLGRTILGGSAGLKGTGMAFAPDLVRDHAWGSALAEDAGFNLELVLKGERVAFEPTAFVLGHVPAELAAAETQNRRWEAGRVDLVRTFLGRLLSRLARGGGILALDSVLDLLVPPLSALVAGLVVLAVAGYFVAPSLGIFNLILLLGVAVHVVWGMAIGGAKAVHYRALVMAPLFLVWKLRLYLPILAGRRPAGWLRTQRD